MVKGIVRYIKTDCYEGDYFALESLIEAFHYVSDVLGPRGWLESLVGKTVIVEETPTLYSVTVVPE